MRRNVIRSTAALIGLLFLAPSAVPPAGAGGVIRYTAVEPGEAALAPFPSWDGGTVVVDLTALAIGQLVQWATLSLPDRFVDGSAIPLGFRFRVHKIDPKSSALMMRIPSGSGRINHFWSADSPFGPLLNMTQQAVECTYIGFGDWLLHDVSQQRGTVQSQRGIDFTPYVVGPVQNNEVIRANASAAGEDIVVQIVDALAWSPPSPVTGGNYFAWRFDVNKDDDSTHKVIVRPAPGQSLTPSNRADGGLELTSKGDWATFYVSASGVDVRGLFRASHLP